MNDFETTKKLLSLYKEFIRKNNVGVLITGEQKQKPDMDFPKAGQTAIFTGVPKFYYPMFTDMKAEAEEHLELNKEYEIERVVVNSSWVSIFLKGVHNPKDIGYSRTFFEIK